MNGTKNTLVLRTWIPVDDTEMTAFIGLNLLAGLHKSNHEPISSLWSEKEGRPVYIATKQAFSSFITEVMIDLVVNTNREVGHAMVGKGRQTSLHCYYV